jgi:hypothetical protein
MRKKTELVLWLLLYGSLLVYAVVAMATKDWRWPLHGLKVLSRLFSNGIRSGGAKTPLLYIGQMMPLGEKGLFRLLVVVASVLVLLATVAVWWWS